MRRFGNFKLVENSLNTAYTCIMKTYPTITSDLEICHGKPVITGTRIMVWQILELLAAGQKPEDIYREFPSLPNASIEAALRFSAERVKFERYVPFQAN